MARSRRISRAAVRARRQARLQAEGEESTPALTPHAPSEPVAAPAPGSKKERLIAALRKHLRENPVFQITSVDGLHWIDPHTGTLVPASFEPEQVALDWLLLNRPWRTHGLKGLQQLRFVRWRQHLAARIEQDPHLRVFSPQGIWLNPYTGSWEPAVHLEAPGRLTGTLLDAMAKCLILLPEDALTQPRPLHELNHLQQSRRLDEQDTASHTLDDDPSLSLSGAHPVIDSWPDDLIDVDAEPPTYAADDDMSGVHALLEDDEEEEEHAKDAGNAVDDAPAPAGTGTVRRVNPQSRAQRSFCGYRLLNKIADGALVGIYRATAIADDSPAALVVLRSELAADEAFAPAFIAQGRRSQQVVHDHLVRCLAVDQDQDRLCMVLELMEDGDFAKRARTSPHCRLPWQEVLPAMQAASAALVALHAVGLSHGNIRPATVFPGGGRIRLGHPPPPCYRLRVAAENAGNPAFATPELLAATSPPDIRSDCYGLGLTAFTLLAGQVPYHDLNPAVMRQRILHDPPPDIRAVVPEVPVSLGRIIKTCLLKSPEERFQQPGELLQALEQVS